MLEELGQTAVAQRSRRLGEAIVASIERALARNPVWWAAVTAILALQFALIFKHEPWLDEWQALQLALQMPTIPDLLHNLRYEGHPPLWYLILRGIGTFADPFWVLPLAGAGFAALAQWLVLSKSPFTRAERWLIASGCLMLFEFLTLSRSMTMGVALLVAAMVLWRSRWVWAVIALLPMCDFLFGVLSGVLMLLQWRDRGPWWPGIAAWLAGGALAAWTVRPAPDMLPALELLGLHLDIGAWLNRIGVLLVPLQWGQHGPEWNALPPFPLGGIFGIGFLYFAWRQTKADRFHRLLLWGFIALTFVFSIAVYPLHARHLMLIALLLILLVWRRASDGSPATAGFRIWLLVGTACGLLVAAVNLAKPFDSAAEAARTIGRLGLADKHWVVHPDSRAQGVSALTGIEFERVERRCMQSFVRWNFNTTLLTRKQLRRYLEDEVAARGRFYVLSDLYLSHKLDPALLKLVAYIPAGYNGQEYFLFVAGANLPDAKPNLRRCVPEQQPLSAARIWRL